MSAFRYFLCFCPAWIPFQSVAAPQTWAPVTNGTVTSIPVDGFIVDTSSRLESLAFYQTVWQASEGATTRIGWTGQLGPCTTSAIGTTSAVFQDDIRRRINYYRALAGLPANITFDAEPVLNAVAPGRPQVTPATVKKQTCAQAAAYMNATSSLFFDPFLLSHSPTPATAYCYSKEAWNGCFRSNLTLGFYGPKAVDVYMADDDLTDDLSNNTNLGHRRNILYSRAHDMSSGDVPPGKYTDATGSYDILPSNALYVTSADRPAEVSPKIFVSWPPRGFVPSPLLPLRWSLSYPNASFSPAPSSITLTGPGGAGIPVTVLSYNNTEHGDNSLIFQPAALQVPGAADVTYTATVTGISGTGVPTSYSWQTTFFNPDLTGLTLTITGPTQPAASGADYQVTPVPLAAAYQAIASTAAPTANFIENADSATPEVIAGKTGVYPLQQGAASLAYPETNSTSTFTPRGGSGKSFHLCWPLDREEPDSLPHDQSFSLTPEFIPASNSNLTFNELFRWLFTVNRLSVELSADGGSRWAEIYGRNGAEIYPSTSYDDFKWDKTWQARTVSLAPWAGQPVRLRFILRAGPVSFDKADIDHGCYIDDIVLTNVRRLTSGPPLTVPGPAFRFDTTLTNLTGRLLTAGTPWLLRVRPQIGFRFMGYSAPLTVTPLPPTPFESAYPAIAAQPQGDADNDGIPNFVEYAFALNPTTPSPASGLPQPVRNSNSLSLGFTIPAGISGITYSAECSTNLTVWTPVPNTGTGSQRTFTVPLTSGQKCLMRLRVTQN